MGETELLILVRIRNGKPKDKELWERFGLRRAGESVILEKREFLAGGGTANSLVTLPLPDDADAEGLSLAAARTVTIAATPWPNTPNVTDTTLLALLGVLSATQVATHQRRIQRILDQMGYDIDAARIDSGPDKQVIKCAETVKDNATGR